MKMKSKLFWTILALALAALIFAASAATSDVSITDYGAVAGDGADDTKAIRDALKHFGMITEGTI